jgi:hypothetical protein
MTDFFLRFPNKIESKSLANNKVAFTFNIRNFLVHLLDYDIGHKSKVRCLSGCTLLNGKLNNNLLLNIHFIVRDSISRLNIIIDCLAYFTYRLEASISLVRAYISSVENEIFWT